MIPAEYYRYFTAMDLRFAEFMKRLGGGDDAMLFDASLLASHRTGLGDICADLGSISGKRLGEIMEAGDEGPALPEYGRWETALRKSPAVGKPGDYRPLILDEAGRLYLHRYWRYERDLVDFIGARSDNVTAPADEGALKSRIADLFPAEEGIQWQRVAAYAAVTRRLCVISGGPGTGKTSTVVKILALLVGDGLSRGEVPSIALAAPTGKASKRLQESVRSALARLPVDDTVRAHIPAESATIHRLIGAMPGSPRVRFGPDNPLPYHIVVVDECSMAAVPLLAKLVRALTAQTRLILLGDRDQLASVDAGAALGDICDTGNAHGYSRAFADGAARVAGVPLPKGSVKKEKPLADSMVILRKSYRFGEGSGIGELAAAVRDGDARRARDILESKKYPDVALKLITSREESSAAIAGVIMERYAGLARLGPADAFGSLSRFAVLCALRRGPYGAVSINAMAERILSEKNLIDPSAPWYRGKPVMVTRNDYGLGLFNGDTGIILPDGESGEDRAFFRAEEGEYRTVIPQRLPEHESAYAMTVHKSQGSEFDNVLVVLSDRHAPVLTRELLYTAITRAKQSVEIWTADTVFEETVRSRIERVSGLRDALWG